MPLATFKNPFFSFSFLHFLYFFLCKMMSASATPTSHCHLKRHVTNNKSFESMNLSVEAHAAGRTVTRRRKSDDRQQHSTQSGGGNAERTPALCCQTDRDVATPLGVSRTRGSRENNPIKWLDALRPHMTRARG